MSERRTTRHARRGTRAGRAARSRARRPRPTAGRAPTGRQRLAAGLWPPRLTRAQLIVALLLFVLGLGLAIQVRSTTATTARCAAPARRTWSASSTELDNRSQRSRTRSADWTSQRRELETSSDQAAEALKQTRQKAAELGVLAGTVAAQGRGSR